MMHDEWVGVCLFSCVFKREAIRAFVATFVTMSGLVIPFSMTSPFIVHHSSFIVTTRSGNAARGYRTRINNNTHGGLHFFEVFEKL